MIFFHLLSVKIHSSSICNNILYTSKSHFSISSNNITEYGFFLTFSVNIHHSSYQTYHADDQISLFTEVLSEYSLISIFIRALGSS
ncbi:hypothetical protein HOF65_02975 [bacterium]|nr:hypothetical protein [bacterium]MBT3852960.1 hypothetical protein [bacterium]MBT4633259.1 hypothetical protein [bacterium]MBT6779017.1 hypothetical protein [bacterium]